MFDFDKAIGFHAQALNVRSKRTEIIANNLANVDTPGYKARDLDFKEAMQRFKGEQIDLSGESEGHISAKRDPFGLMSMKFRPSIETSLDGNNVDKDMETAAFSKNVFDYQTSLTYLNGSISALRKSIKGEM
jgi:flagellar basal-body rod protein FlgB